MVPDHWVDYDAAFYGIPAVDGRSMKLWAASWRIMIAERLVERIAALLWGIVARGGWARPGAIRSLHPQALADDVVELRQAAA
jgi:hypothetical protein